MRGRIRLGGGFLHEAVWTTLKDDRFEETWGWGIASKAGATPGGTHGVGEI